MTSFFDNFILSHTLNLASLEETKARLCITEEFLNRFPMNDFGFEVVTFQDLFKDSVLRKMVENFGYLKSYLNERFETKIHFSLHFPFTSDTSLFLGSDDAAIERRIIGIFKQVIWLCNHLSAGVIVVHLGSVIDLDYWQKIKANSRYKPDCLHRTASILREMIGISDDLDYDVVIALENMPYPFDIPRFSFTGVLWNDFEVIFRCLEEYGVQDGMKRVKCCLDLCHLWIVSRTARYYKKIYQANGVRETPPGIYDGEWGEFIKLSDPLYIIGKMRDKIAHLHASDSRGDFNIDRFIQTQPTEGDEIGTGDFFNSGWMQKMIEYVSTFISDDPGKRLCTLEVRDVDFLNPQVARRSLHRFAELFHVLDA
ncbi:MAG: TIM barrel protein [Promethearchaeota archaeon]